MSDLDVSNKYIKENFGFSNLLGKDNPKTSKGEKYGYRTFILHLAPSNLSGNNVCPSASRGCAHACLNTSGLGCMPNTVNARMKRTEMFFEDRERFMQRLDFEIKRSIKNAENATYTDINGEQQKGLIPVFRLNGTSDIKFENIKYGKDKKTVFEYFPNIQFYDYTKIPKRGKNPFPNYDLTFSRSEDNEKFVGQAMEKGQNVAVVFGVNKNNPEDLPKKWKGPTGLTWPVLNGDQSDLRFLDPKKRIVGLTMKGRASQDTTGFVLYGDNVIDFSKLSEYKKRASKDPSILGQRKYGTETFVPIQSRLSKSAANRTAEILRKDGRKARVIEHKPLIAGKTRTAYAVYTPGTFRRFRNQAIMHLSKRSRRPLIVNSRR
tara:strand:+ start:21066 stop:22196 length:1131 start_codon:yes stop_codon:yes gene_type:complete